MRLDLKFTCLFSLLSLSACASGLHVMTSDNFGLNETAPLQNEAALKHRLVKVSARLMRANAHVCPQTRPITTHIESFDICSNTVGLQISPVKNAHTNGRTILVTSAMIDALNDDQLAFIIAHELAHSVAGHDIGLGSTVQSELDADQTAVFLMARANYYLPSAIEALSVLGIAQLPQTDSHPSGSDRANIILGAIDRVKQDRRQGLNPGP